MRYIFIIYIYIYDLPTLYFMLLISCLNLYLFISDIFIDPSN